jgi:hypothetical protein
MDDLYPAIEREVMDLVDAEWKYRTEDNPDLDYWQPVAELPTPYLDGVVQKCPRWRFALERLLEAALAQWPRPGMPFETVNPRLNALRAAALALVSEDVGAEGEAYLRWVAATNRIGKALHEMRSLAIAAGKGAGPLASAGEPTGGRGSERPSELLDLDQVAALVHLKKRSLENYKRRKRDPLPSPDFPGGGGRRDFWRWSTIRPWLSRNFHIPIPEHFPGISSPR